MAFPAFSALGGFGMDYSAAVDMWLEVGSDRVSLTHIGRSGFRVRQPCTEAGPCEARLHTVVGTRHTSRLVFLPFGVVDSSESQAFF